TDKVDAEIPSPVAGVLAEIRSPEGSTVEVNTVVAVIAEGAPEEKAAVPASLNPGVSRAAKSAPTKRETKQPEPAGPKAAAPKATAPEAAAPEPAAPEPAPSTARTEVIMPQMGESIFEGTITKWFSKAGDGVRKDEPLFEISTDKVDAEIPAPVSGVLTEIKV